MAFCAAKSGSSSVATVGNSVSVGPAPLAGKKRSKPEQPVSVTGAAAGIPTEPQQQLGALSAAVEELGVAFLCAAVVAPLHDATSEDATGGIGSACTASGVAASDDAVIGQTDRGQSNLCTQMAQLLGRQRLQESITALRGVQSTVAKAIQVLENMVATSPVEAQVPEECQETCVVVADNGVGAAGSVAAGAVHNPFLSRFARFARASDSNLLATAAAPEHLSKNAAKAKTGTVVAAQAPHPFLSMSAGSGMPPKLNKAEVAELLRIIQDAVVAPGAVSFQPVDPRLEKRLITLRSLVQSASTVHAQGRNLAQFAVFDAQKQADALAALFPSSSQPAAPYARTSSTADARILDCTKSSENADVVGVTNETCNSDADCINEVGLGQQSIVTNNARTAKQVSLWNLATGYDAAASNPDIVGSSSQQFLPEIFSQSLFNTGLLGGSTACPGAGALSETGVLSEVADVEPMDSDMQEGDAVARTTEACAVASDRGSAIEDGGVTIADGDPNAEAGIEADAMEDLLALMGSQPNGGGDSPLRTSADEPLASQQPHASNSNIVDQQTPKPVSSSSQIPTTPAHASQKQDLSLISASKSPPSCSWMSQQQEPDWGSYSDKALQMAMASYGMRPGDRAYMVEELKTIWTHLHASETSTTHVNGKKSSDLPLFGDQSLISSRSLSQNAEQLLGSSRAKESSGKNMPSVNQALRSNIQGMHVPLSDSQMHAWDDILNCQDDDLEPTQMNEPYNSGSIT
jgi:hypothetical protein